MTTPVNKFNSATHPKFQALINALTNLLPTSVPSSTGPGAETFSGFDFSFGVPGVSEAAPSAGFRIVLEVDPTGHNLTITAKQSNVGPNNPFGPVDGGVANHYSRAPAIVISGDVMP